jgi:DnaT-like ssDNA binding protein
VALDSTVGGVSANSYVSQATATTYLTDKLSAALLASWTAASSGDKDSYLIAATVRLDTERWMGSKVFFDQRLQWPRYGTYDPDGIVYDHLVIPLPIEQATAELAYALLGTPTMMDATGLDAFQNVRIGSLDVTPRGVSVASLPPLVKRLIAPLRLAGSSGYVSRA